MSTQYAGGPVLSIPVSAGGVGWSVAPTVVLSGAGNGFGATFTVNLSGGSVSSVTVNTGGHLYPKAGLTATLSGGNGTGASLGTPVVSGGDVNTTYTSDGTKQNLINALETALLAAGWTTVSGHATTNLLMQTYPTPYPLQANFRFKDNGQTGIEISVENTAGTVVGGSSNVAFGALLIPNSTRVFRIIANPYQFCVIVPAVFNLSGTFAFAGVPYVPTFLTGVTAAGLCVGNSSYDYDGSSNRPSWRVQLVMNGNNNTNPNFQCLWNSSVFVNSNNNISPQWTSAAPCLLMTMFADYPAIGLNTQPYRWAGLQIHSCDPLISWGLTGPSDEALIRGQLWDALIVCDGYAGDVTSSWDNHNWYALTNNNTTPNSPVSGVTGARGTLFLVTP